MLGSRRRGDAILRMLREEGVSEESLARIRVPIGLDLGAKTAPEIALAILAEIVASRYGGTGRPLALAKPARPVSVAADAPPTELARDAGVPRVKAHALVPSDASAERLVGWVLAHDVRDAAGALLGRKGDRLDPAGAARLVAGSREEVHLLEMEPGDLHEDPAGERVARAVAGAGVSVRDSASGQWAIVAGQRGIVRVATGSLAAVNGLEGVSVYTLFDRQVVDAGEVVASRQGHTAGRRRERGPRGRGAHPATRGVRGRAALPRGRPWARSRRAVSRSGRARGSRRSCARSSTGSERSLASLAYPDAETAALGRAVEESIAAGSANRRRRRSQRARSARSRLHGDRTDRRPARAERRAGASGESPLGRAGGGDPGPGHAGVRHVLPGDPLRLAASAPPGGGDRRR